MKILFKRAVEGLTSSDPLFLRMEQTTEGSMHHREANVLVHTLMVLNEYYKITPENWNISHVEGALACLFHDVGKPDAEVDKHSPERGHYHSYPGHEIISSRTWENWVVDHYSFIISLFPTFNFKSIYRVGWMIEHHLPYSIVNPYKLECIYKTGKTFGNDTFKNVLIADATGRITDNKEEHAVRLQTWIDGYDNYQLQPTSIPDFMNDDAKHVHMFIGPSGIGKTEIINTLMEKSPPNVVSIFSIDECRLKWYSDLLIMDEETHYKHVIAASDADPNFIKKYQYVYKLLVNGPSKMILIDGSFLTAKQRRFFLDLAKSRNRYTHGVYLTSSLNVLEYRIKKNETPHDMDVIAKQYAAIQYPSYHEFDNIEIL